MTGHQFCNDWLTADGPNGEALTLSPTQVQLTTDADREFFTRPDPATCGSFWTEFRLTEDGRFERTGEVPPHIAARIAARRNRT